MAIREFLADSVNRASNSQLRVMSVRPHVGCGIYIKLKTKQNGNK